MIGRVVSKKSTSTATVLVERLALHPLYKKTYVQTKKYLVNDEVGIKPGDIVEIVNCKPISKNKHWKITKVLGKSLTEIAEEHLKEKSEQAIAEVMPEEKVGNRVQGVGFSEETEEKEKKKKIRKEKLAPKP